MPRLAWAFHSPEAVAVLSGTFSDDSVALITNGVPSGVVLLGAVAMRSNSAVVPAAM